jgi:hypothetical protein
VASIAINSSLDVALMHAVPAEFDTSGEAQLSGTEEVFLLVGLQAVKPTATIIADSLSAREADSVIVSSSVISVMSVIDCKKTDLCEWLANSPRSMLTPTRALQLWL